MNQVSLDSKRSRSNRVYRILAAGAGWLGMGGGGVGLGLFVGFELKRITIV